LSTDVYLPHANNNLNCEYSYPNFASGNYNLLYNILSTCDWTGVYGTSSVDVAVASLNAAVRDATQQVFPRGCNRKSKSPPWFSNTLRYYIVEKNYFHRHFKKKQSDYFYDKFAFYRKLVKTLSSLKGLDG
jgi:hypothetical protein